MRLLHSSAVEDKCHTGACLVTALLSLHFPNILASDDEVSMLMVAFCKLLGSSYDTRGWSKKTLVEKISDPCISQRTDRHRLQSNSSLIERKGK
jgi:hypothetical protein